jgi:hypothetical protein
VLLLFFNNNRSDEVGNGEKSEINEENDLLTNLTRDTKKKIDKMEGNETILPPSKKKKNQTNSNFNSIILLPQNNLTNSTINRDMSLRNMVVKDTPLSKTSSLICVVSLEESEAGL